MSEAGLWTYRARLHRLIDADTAEIACDLGFEIVHVIRVRIAGVNAPERYTDAGRAATAWVQDWLNALYAVHPDIQWPLRIRTYQIQSRYGVLQSMTFARYVADLWSAASGERLDDALVAAGHAERVTD